MRIDQNLSAILTQQSKDVSKTGSKTAASSSSATTASTETGSEGVFATLTAASGDLGEARTQRVQALQDAVTSGSYKVEPEKVADSMIAATLY
jgi:flagellar biosynthesis anti-sigma factor FlgM